MTASYYLYILLKELDKSTDISDYDQLILGCEMKGPYLELYFQSEDTKNKFMTSFGVEINRFLKEHFEELAGAVFSVYEEPHSSKMTEGISLRPDFTFEDLDLSNPAVLRAKELADGISGDPLILLSPRITNPSVILHAIMNHALSKNKRVFYMRYDLVDKLISVHLSGMESLFRDELAKHDYFLFDCVEFFEKQTDLTKQLFLNTLQDICTMRKPFVLASNSEMPTFEYMLRQNFAAEVFFPS